MPPGSAGSREATDGPHDSETLLHASVGWEATFGEGMLADFVAKYALDLAATEGSRTRVIQGQSPLDLLRAEC